jgi:hypothetical protein
VALTQPVHAPSCASPTAEELIASRLREVVTDKGVEADLDRRMYNLPRVPADSVIAVHDENVCERAARAYYRYRLGPMPEGGLIVVRVRSRYAVYGANRAGEWTIMSIFSLAFEPIVNIAM